LFTRNTAQQKPAIYDPEILNTEQTANQNTQPTSPLISVFQTSTGLGN